MRVAISRNRAPVWRRRARGSFVAHTRVMRIPADACRIALVAIAALNSACVAEPGEHDISRPYRVIALTDGGERYENPDAWMFCAAWAPECPTDPNVERTTSCVCTRYRLTSGGFAIEWDAEAAQIGTTLNTANGSLVVRDRAAIARGSGEVAITKRMVRTFRESAFSVEFAGTFAVDSGDIKLSNGVFFAVER